jgi:IS5 family transposase
VEAAKTKAQASVAEATTTLTQFRERMLSQLPLSRGSATASAALLTEGAAVEEGSLATAPPASAATGGILGLALGLAQTVVSTAVQKAAELDAKHGITERLASLDGQYALTEKATMVAQRAQAAAVAIDAKYNVTGTVQSALEKAKAVDGSVTGGRGSALAESAVQTAGRLAGEGVQYAKQVVADYESKKASLTGAGGSTGDLSSPNTASTEEAATAVVPGQEVTL